MLHARTELDISMMSVPLMKRDKQLLKAELEGSEGDKSPIEAIKIKRANEVIKVAQFHVV